MTIVLASGSASRRAMLEAAGVQFEIERPTVDEDGAKASFRAEGFDPRQLADALAELKALSVSRRRPGRVVVGSDSVVALANGTVLDKPVDRADAARHLRAMRGGRHRILSAAVAARDGVPVWRAVDGATLHVRAFSDAWLEDYLDVEWPAIGACVGCFRIEGPGVQLFARVDGSHFTVLGMPLLPLLGWLRDSGAMPA